MWGPKQEKVRVCTQTLARVDWSATGRWDGQLTSTLIRLTRHLSVSLDRAVVRCGWRTRHRQSLRSLDYWGLTARSPSLLICSIQSIHEFCIQARTASHKLIIKQLWLTSLWRSKSRPHRWAQRPGTYQCTARWSQQLCRSWLKIASLVHRNVASDCVNSRKVRGSPGGGKNSPWLCQWAILAQWTMHNVAHVADPNARCSTRHGSHHMQRTEQCTHGSHHMQCTVQKIWRVTARSTLTRRPTSPTPQPLPTPPKEKVFKKKKRRRKNKYWNDPTTDSTICGLEQKKN